MRRLLNCLLAVCICCSLSGCGVSPTADYSKINLLNGSGSVTLDGNPLSSAIVTFESEDGQFSYAMTDSNGRFKLQFDSVKSGVTPGKKTVRISTTHKILGLNAEEGDATESREGSMKASPVELVPERYNKKSELTVVVSRDKSHFEFSLLTK